MSAGKRDCGGHQWPASYSVQQYEERYGKLTVLYMLEKAERDAYVGKILEIEDKLHGEPDLYRNVQVGLDAWTPFADRPPLDAERVADELMGLPAEVWDVVNEILRERDRVKKEQERLAQAAKTNERLATLPTAKPEPAPTADLGPPVTTHQTDPGPLLSFEELARAAEAAEAQAKADKDLYDKPAEFEKPAKPAKKAMKK